MEPRYPVSSQRKPGPRSTNSRGNGSNGSRGDTRAPVRREHGANGNIARTDSRQPWGKKQEWSTQPSNQRRAEPDPYDRQGDRFRAELRTQAERSPYAGNGNRKSGPKPFNREQPYAQVDDHRGNGAATAIRRVPQITVLAKKAREE